MKSEKLNRRDFIVSAVSATAVTSIASMTPEVADAAPRDKSPIDSTPKSKNPPAPTSNTYQYLRFTEAAFVESVVDIMIPADKFSPSGTSCGVAIYIDRQLGGSWGRGDRLYKQGPFFGGKPSQGYQLPLLPSDVIRHGIAATNEYCKLKYKGEFDGLTDEQKNEVLNGLFDQKVTLEGVPGKVFIEALYTLVMEGFFADPMYGGNKNKASWVMMGFPGIDTSNYRAAIGKFRDKKYVAKPKSIEDYT